MRGAYESYREAALALGFEPPTVEAWEAALPAAVVISKAVAEAGELLARVAARVSELQRRVAALEASSGGNTFHT